MKLTQQELDTIIYAIIKTYGANNMDELIDKLEDLNNYSIVPEEDTFTAYGKKEDWSE